MSSGRRRLRRSQRVVRSSRIRRAEQHRRLGRGRDLAVERLDRGPELAEPEHLAGGRVGTGDLVGRSARLVAEPEDERRAAAVDEVVRDPRGDDLAPQRVPLELRREALAQTAREVARELAREVRVVGQVGGEQRLRERDLRVREEDRELGRGQAAARRGALLERLVARQELELAIEHAGLLEAADVALVHLRHRRGLGRGALERLRLVVVVAQDECRHLVGHLGQQLVSLLPRQVAVGDDRVEQDLDVDLVVGAVDAGRVVDRVREDAAAAERVLDPGALREAEVAALADHSRRAGPPRRRERRRSPCRRPRRAARRAPSRRCRCRRSRAGRPAPAGAPGSARSASAPRPRCRAPPAPRATAGSTWPCAGKTPPPGEISAAS